MTLGPIVAVCTLMTKNFIRPEAHIFEDFILSHDDQTQRGPWLCGTRHRDEARGSLV